MSVVALLALLTLWIVTMGGGGGKNGDNGADGKNPAPSITPGPSGSGPPSVKRRAGATSRGRGLRWSGDGSGSGSGDGSGSGPARDPATVPARRLGRLRGCGRHRRLGERYRRGRRRRGRHPAGRLHPAQLHRERGEVQPAQRHNTYTPADAHVRTDRAEHLRQRLQGRSRAEERGVHDRPGEQRRRLLVLRGLPQGPAHQPVPGRRRQRHHLHPEVGPQAERPRVRHASRGLGQSRDVPGGGQGPGLREGPDVVRALGRAMPRGRILLGAGVGRTSGPPGPGRIRASGPQGRRRHLWSARAAAPETYLGFAGPPGPERHLWSARAAAPETYSRPGRAGPRTPEGGTPSRVPPSAVTAGCRTRQT